MKTSGRSRIAPDGFYVNQILADIENIFKFKDLVPMPIGAGEAQTRSKYSPMLLESMQ